MSTVELLTFGISNCRIKQFFVCSPYKRCFEDQCPDSSSVCFERMRVALGLLASNCRCRAAWLGL